MVRATLAWFRNRAAFGTWLAVIASPLARPGLDALLGSLGLIARAVTLRTRCLVGEVLT
jgi:hypothetical protein